MEFDREKVSASLDLPLSLFPLLSCLLGNDVVNYDGLEKFHKRLVDTTGSLLCCNMTMDHRKFPNCSFCMTLPPSQTDLNIPESKPLFPHHCMCSV